MTWCQLEHEKQTTKYAKGAQRQESKQTRPKYTCTCNWRKQQKCNPKNYQKQQSNSITNAAINTCKYMYSLPTTILSQTKNMVTSKYSNTHDTWTSLNVYIHNYRQSSINLIHRENYFQKIDSYNRIVFVLTCRNVMKMKNTFLRI